MRILLHILIALGILGLGVGAYHVMKDPEKLEKMGFKVEGKLRQHECIDGCFVDKIILGILRST